MHNRNRGARDGFFDFGDPFAVFGGFPGHRSLTSSFFGGRDPFDDPFFRNPFGSMIESSLFGSFGRPFGSPFENMHASGFLEHQAPEPKRPRGPIIEEINSDDEKEEAEEQEKPKNPSKAPVIDDPDDEGEEKVNKPLQLVDYHSGSNHNHFPPQACSFTFQSSSVTYGSSNGTYYTSSNTRRTGSDGLTFEESKKADTATRQATHRISRGLHNKGHSITRKLNSDGRVNTMQTLHNLNGDQVDGFENAWEKKARSVPGWSESSNNYDNIGRIGGHNGQTSRGGRALPGPQHPPQVAGRMTVEGCGNPCSSHTRQMRKRKKDAIHKNA